MATGFVILDRGVILLKTRRRSISPALLDVIWDLARDLDGNVQHIADPGLNTIDAEHVLNHPDRRRIHRSNRPANAFSGTLPTEYRCRRLYEAKGFYHIQSANLVGIVWRRTLPEFPDLARLKESTPLSSTRFATSCISPAWSTGHLSA